MGWDFWNNPLIVSALRIRYRQGGPMLYAAGYLVLWIAAAVFIWYSNAGAGGWLHVYFMILMSVQTAVSALIAFTQAQASLKAEVVSRTLDFQRTSTLTPYEILWGKLLGDPTLAYLLALTIFPLCMICAAGGAVSLPVLLLLYVSLFTSTLMAGMVGLLQSVDVNEENAAQSGCLTLVVWYFVFNLWVIAASDQSDAGNMLLGLLTPIKSLAALWAGDPWGARLDFYGYWIPFLYLTPWFQLALTLLLMRGMARRLVTPQLRILGKGESLLVLAIVDVVVAGYVVSLFSDGQPVRWMTGWFLSTHLATSLLLTLVVTPNRSMVVAQMWRRRETPWGPLAGLRNGREVNTLFLVCCGLLAGVMLLAVVVAPMVAMGGRNEVQPLAQAFVLRLAIVTVAIVAIGTLYQALILVSKSALLLTPLLLVLSEMALVLPSTLYQWEWPIRNASLVLHVASWCNDLRDPPAIATTPQTAAAMIGLYLSIALLAGWTQRLSLRKESVRIEKTIAEMLAEEPAREVA